MTRNSTEFPRVCVGGRDPIATKRYRVHVKSGVHEI